jgi:hypothetical protein
VIGGNSKALETNASELRKIRWIGLSAFFICFSVLCLINYLQPDPFYLLLSMAGGVAIFAPLIVTVGYLASKQNALRVFVPKVIFGFLLIFVVSGISDFILLSNKSFLVSYVGTVAFIISICFCCVLAFIGLRQPR